MRKIYKNPERTIENRLLQWAYYIPKGKSEYRLLNGSWRFANFARDIDAPIAVEVIPTALRKGRFCDDCCRF